MKTKTLVTVGLGIFGIGKLLAKTTTGIISAYNNLQYEIINLKNLHINKDYATFNFDLVINNPTPNGIGDIFGFAKIRDIWFLNEDGTAFATAFVPEKKLFIPGNHKLIINNIAAKIDYNNIKFNKLLQNFGKADMKFPYVVNFEIAGQPYTYEGIYDLTHKGLNGSVCYNRAKCPGLKKNGQLRKGYRFIKGGAIKKI